MYICRHEWLILMVNVGKHTSPMDPLGLGDILGLLGEAGTSIALVDRAKSQTSGLPPGPQISLQNFS